MRMGTLHIRKPFKCFPAVAGPTFSRTNCAVGSKKGLQFRLPLRQNKIPDAIFNREGEGVVPAGESGRGPIKISATLRTY